MGWIIGEAAKLSKGIRDKLENMGLRILTINGNANMNAMLRENILHRPVRQDLRS
jgi:phosphoribosylamine-glycine ligase